MKVELRRDRDTGEMLLCIAPESETEWVAMMDHAADFGFTRDESRGHFYATQRQGVTAEKPHD